MAKRWSSAKVCITTSVREEEGRMVDKEESLSATPGWVARSRLKKKEMVPSRQGMAAHGRWGRIGK